MKNLCRSNGTCSGTCEQGECLGSINASRAAFWLPPLQDDPAPATPDDALGWLFCLICVAMFAIACFVAIALVGVPLVYPFA